MGLSSFTSTQPTPGKHIINYVTVVVQGHRKWYQSKVHMRLSISLVATYAYFYRMKVGPWITRW